MTIAPDDRSLVIPHESAHFLAAHLLGIEVEDVRVGRMDTVDDSCGAVRLSAPHSVSDAEWSLIASAGYGAQLALGLPLLAGQAGGDIALLNQRGLEAQFVATGRWILSERAQLNALIGVIEDISAGQDALILGHTLHGPLASTFGSHCAEDVAIEFAT